MLSMFGLFQRHAQSESASLHQSTSSIHHELESDSEASTPVTFAVSFKLLAKCIQFLTSKERVSIARGNSFLHSVCCSATSWCCDDVLDTLQNSARNSRYNKFHFNAPSLQCSLNELQLAKKSRIFKQAHCIELLWKNTASTLIDIRDVNAWPHLQHLFVSEGRVEPAIFQQLGTVDQLPSGLKSFTFICDRTKNAADRLNHTRPVDARQLLEVLGPSLHTLQIIASSPYGVAPRCELEFQNLFSRLPNLQQFTLAISRSNEIQEEKRPTPFINALSLGTKATQNPPLNIYCDFFALPEVAETLQPTQRSFLASVRHLRLANGDELLRCDPAWFPNLDSLYMESFTETKENQSKPPPTSPLGKQIRSLVFRSKWSDSKEQAEGGDFFHRHGFTNLTSLTVFGVFHPKQMRVDELGTLTHLSITDELCYHRENLKFPFDNYKKLPNLTSLETNTNVWPATLIQSIPGESTLIAPQIDAIIESFSAASSSEATESSSNSTSSTVAPALPTQPSDLASIFPALTKLKVVVHDESERVNCYDLRDALATIPHLKSIVWGQEPQLHPCEIDSYYSHEAIEMRERRRIAQELVEDLSRPPKTKQGSAFQGAQQVGYERRSKSTIARKFNEFSLSLLFQFLVPLELARASTVSKHWRSAALSPFSLHHRFRFEMHQQQGVIVHGPKACIRKVSTMIQACNSALFRNLRNLTLETYKTPRLPRESHFAHHHLRLFMHIPQLISLDTLYLDWQWIRKTEEEDEVIIGPTAQDLASIRRVMESDTLQKLKVFRINARPEVVYTMIQFLPKLKSLEVVELRYARYPYCWTDQFSSTRREEYDSFILSMLEVSSLKQLYVSKYDSNTYFTQLEELSEFCNSVSAENFEEVMWRVPIESIVVERLSKTYREYPSFTFPHVKSIHINSLKNSLDLLSKSSAAMPHLCDISVGCILLDSWTTLDRPLEPLDASLASRLRSLKLEVRADKFGKLTISVLQALVTSELNLHCLHLWRDEKSKDPATEPIAEELATKLVSNFTELRELNLGQWITLNSQCWERSLPRLHILYLQPAILPLVDRCLQIREFHSTFKIAYEVQRKFIQLPYFQFLSVDIKRNNHPIGFVVTRADIVKQEPVNPPSAAEAEERALQMLAASSSSDNSAQAAMWRVNTEAQSEEESDDESSSDENDRLSQILTSLGRRS